MSERGRHRALADGLLVATLLLIVATVVFLVLAWEIPTLPTQFGPKGFAIAFGLTLGITGWVLARRVPSNAIGWIFSVLGLVSGVMALGAEYARWAVLVEGGRPPAALLAAGIEEWLWIPLVGGLGLTAAIFPDGRFLSSGWRRATTISAILAAASTIPAAMAPRFTVYVGYDNPLGVGDDTMQEIATAAPALMMPLMVVGAAAAIARFRRSRGDERQQLKWLALSASWVTAMVVFYAVVTEIVGIGGDAGGLDWAEYLMIAAFLSVPVSIGFGVLKYRLYDIDIVINRAVVYGALAVFITLVYVAIAVGVGAAVGARGEPVLSAIAAAIVALAFQPLRRRAQHLANRLVYGRRATPYEVLSELSSRFAGTYSLEDALPRLARVTAEAVGAERTDLWLWREGGYVPAAGWPDGSDRTQPTEGDPSFEIRHQGELLGSISVDMPASEPLSATQDKLLRDVADQAGLVLRNVALLEDVRTSRRRLVAAQDERARKLERDIHDGAQQQLVALAVKLRLAGSLVGRDDDQARALLAELGQDTNDALETLRNLARGIYPPLLADQGLGEALAAQARRSAVPVEIHVDGIGRYPQEAEAAVYFCVLEALNNVAKYAEASRVEVRLWQARGELRFEVRDDGRGFDPTRNGSGTGLQGMADRLAALGGEVEVTSAPGAGTRILGRIEAEART